MNNEELQQLKREVEELRAWKASLEASHSIPLNVDQAFRARFLSNQVKTSSKSVSSENQAVDEGGTGQYSVLKTPDAFLEVVASGGTYYIPVFT